MYVSLIRDKYCTWIEKGREIEDPRVLWDYSKLKARERRATLSSLERKIKNCQIACDKNPSSKNLNDLEILQTDYDRMYEFIVQGATVRSRATWYVVVVAFI